MGHSHSRRLFPRRDKLLNQHRRSGSNSGVGGAPFDQLPLLVLECVCHHLCWHCLTDYAPARRLSNAEEEVRREGIETLYRLCLVSRAVRDVAQPILFHRFRGIRAAQIAKFTLILQLRPDLALAVRTLQLELQSSNEDLTVDLIHLLPSLRSLELFHAPGGWTFKGLREGCLPSLEMLSIKFFSLGERTALLKAAPKMRHLVVSSCNPTVLEDTVTRLESVRRLALNDCFPTARGTAYRDFKSIVDLCDRLESFELVSGPAGPGRVSGLTGKEIITMLTPRWSSLKHLRLVGYGHDLEHHAGPDIEPISSLAEFPALVTVAVPTVVIYGSGERRQALKRVSKDFLPPSIKKLTLEWLWELDVDVLPVDLLELTERIAEGRFNGIERIELHSQSWKQIVRRIPGCDELERSFQSVGVTFKSV
ncbi:hypothetical protein MKZ38_004763 [Zalerion maritima]|uniref:Uncharacterized protein n=1 Tax=Zalerion maritima TaxID=339359 RepID=A0AAD5WUE7_9PEZI|nr:hypothetical protein MKZ38_004763 [Zalerion maritima]